MSESSVVNGDAKPVSRQVKAAMTKASALAAIDALARMVPPPDQQVMDVARHYAVEWLSDVPPPTITVAGEGDDLSVHFRWGKYRSVYISKHLQVIC